MTEWHSTDRAARSSSIAEIALDDTPEAAGVERGRSVLPDGIRPP
jgi:hypothetical protein